MIKIKKILVTFAISLGLFVPAAVPAIVGAQDIQDGLKKGTCLSTTGGDCDTTDPDEQINSIIETVINLFSLVVGVISVIMIIIGGLKYITSGGDSGNVTGAKNTILYAVVGLVIVALAQVIVRFVLNEATTI